MLVLKIGGSVFARDEASLAIDEETLARLADELRPFLGRLLVVHGAGHFARTLLPRQPREDRLRAGDRDAVARLRKALEEIGSGLAAALSRAGLPVAASPPVEGAALRALVIDRRLPLLRGEVLDAPDGGFRIVSSDRMTERAALASGAGRVVWATDVDGVLGGDQRVVPLVMPADFESELDLALGERRGTGSMRGKLESALRLADRGVSSLVINGLVADRVGEALAGRRVLGTLVSPPRGARA